MPATTSNFHEPSESRLLHPQSFILDRREFGQRLQVTAKKYIISSVISEGHHPKPERTILILAHADGLHKEQWEPFLEDLFVVQCNRRNDRLPFVSEAWCIDKPDAGKGASTNEDDLFLNPCAVDSVEYASSIITLLDSGLISHSGPPPNLILGGHLSGCNSIILAARQLKMRQMSSYNLLSLFLIDPILRGNSSSNHYRSSTIDCATSVIYESEPLNLESAKQPCDKWDPRCQQLIMEYGSHKFTVPSHGHLDEKNGDRNRRSLSRMVTPLKNYDSETAFRSSLSSLSHVLPVHVVFGEANLTRRDSELMGKGFGQYPFASVRTVKAGHWVLQEQPWILSCHFDDVYSGNATCLFAPKEQARL